MTDDLTAPVMEEHQEVDREDFIQIAKGAEVLLKMAFEEVRKLRRITLRPGAAKQRDVAQVLVTILDLQVLQLMNVVQHMQKEA